MFTIQRRVFQMAHCLKLNIKRPWKVVKICGQRIYVYSTKVRSCSGRDEVMRAFLGSGHDFTK
jgi:hypothetical protein